jgi:N-acetylglucosaminyl-diphospho-decaprenol L-rhamnosyltransferase
VERPAVSVIIVTWNAGDVLGDCLDSIARQRVEGGHETIVVDSGSTDRTAELLRGRDDVVTISHEENVGFSRGNNEAARVARGEVLFFLNSDTVLLDPDVLAALAAVARRPEVGLVGPRLENPDGSLQPSCAGHLGIGRALLLSSGIHRLLPDRVLARAVPDRWSHDHARDTGWLMGAAVAIRADLFAELGGFWLTMYAEDTDLAYRLQRRGLRVRYEPSVRVMHIGNHSLAKRWDPAQRAERVARAEVAFIETHFGRGRAVAIRAITLAGLAARAAAHRLLGRRERAAVYRAMARVYRAS